MTTMLAAQTCQTSTAPDVAQSIEVSTVLCKQWSTVGCKQLSRAYRPSRSEVPVLKVAFPPTKKTEHAQKWYMLRMTAAGLGGVDRFRKIDDPEAFDALFSKKFRDNISKLNAAREEYFGLKMKAVKLKNAATKMRRNGGNDVKTAAFERHSAAYVRSATRKLEMIVAWLTDTERECRSNWKRESIEAAGGVVGGGAAADPFLSMLEKAEFVDDVGVSW